MDNSSSRAPAGGIRLLSHALSRLPAFHGKGRVVNTAGRLAVMSGHRWATCSLGKGAAIRVDLNDRIQRQMWGGCYEPHVQRALRSLLKPGEAFADVGAHVGYHAALASVLVGPTGKVFAFEADPGNFAQLEKNLQPIAWASAIHKAVWSSTGRAGFERSSEPTESGWGTLTDVRDLGSGDHLILETVSLDDWFRDVKMRISVIKMDAEGSEAGILQGARNFLCANRPAIIIEANDVVLRQARTSAVELVETLFELGFDVFEFDGTKLPKLGVGETPGTNELLALPAESAKQQLAKLQA